MKKQISAIERLLSLPALFRGSDLTVRFQWTSKTASHYLYLWKRRGLVRGLGGHSDVFANLLKDPSPNWDRALLMAMPSAIVIGVEALRRAGWTTQIQRRPTIAVRADQSVFSLDKLTAPRGSAIGAYAASDFEGFMVQTRSAEWFKKVGNGAMRLSEHEAPVLKPAWALADMLTTEGWGKCGLCKDDIYLDDMTTEDESGWAAACVAFGLPVQPLEDQSEPSR